MNKYLLTTLLLLISPLSYSSGTYYLNPYELSLKGALSEPYSEFQISLRLNKEDRRITFLEINIDGNKKIIPVKDLAHIKGVESRTLLVGTQRGEVKLTQSSEGQTMHFGTYEFIVLDVNFEAEKHCDSGYKQMNLVMKLSDLTYDISEYCVDEEDN